MTVLVHGDGSSDVVSVTDRFLLGGTMSEQVPPTLEQFSKYQQAWAWFNAELFDGKLNPCLLNFSRHRGSLGFFTPCRWRKGDKEIHEISLNPDRLSKPLADVMSTLVHEMVHQWQFDLGDPPRSGYHDMQWAEKMAEVGLIPSDTGEPGGKPTGQRMTHFIEPDGRFANAVSRMPAEYILPWISDGLNATAKPKKPRKKKYRFTCPACQIQIWAELSELDVECVNCGELFLSSDNLKGEVK